MTGGGGEEGRKERKEPARRSSGAGREREGRGVEEPDKKSAGRFVGIEVLRRSRDFSSRCARAVRNKIGRITVLGDAEVDIVWALTKKKKKNQIENKIYISRLDSIVGSIKGPSIM